jgi:hypothetical protein
MKKYTVITEKTSKWVWETMADSEDDAKATYEEGIVVSKQTNIQMTVTERE